ncbi:MAG: hypothetical protein FWG80_04615 [Alphaproteobacteria bacterium]|nr:hypothetical protein [Alphaproteobacteria bacterium]
MNTFNKTIKLTSIFAVLTIIPLHGSIAAVACVPKPTSPTSCSSANQCPASGTGGSSWNQDCNNLSLGNWRIGSCTGSNVSEFSGMSLCSSTSGVQSNIGNPVADSGSNCWCKLTSIPGYSVVSSTWVFSYGNIAPSHCAAGCANDCAYVAQVTSDFRLPLFAGLGL